MTGTPDASVIIPVRNGASTIGAQLEALALQDFEGTWEVLVVDNGSGDDLHAVVHAYSDRLPGLRVVDAGERRGVPYARNCGARAARAELLALCDADDEVDPGWLRAIVSALRCCDHVGGFVDERTINSPVVVSWSRPHPSDRLKVAVELLPFATGANCGVRREVVEAIGGWDESYGTAANDVEFSFRVQLAGYRLCWAPDAVVRYRLRPSLSGHARRSFRTGRSYAQLVRDFGAFGARDRRWDRRLRDWAKLVVLAPAAVVSESKRGTWVGLLATEAGRACGSLVYRWRPARRDRPPRPS